MARIQLFEFEDQPWFPRTIRNYGTDFLQFIANTTKIFRPVIPVIEQGIENLEEKQLVDLGSGGGGSLIWLNTELRKDIPRLRILLTDLYPNIPALAYLKANTTNIDYVKTPVDARNVSEEHKGLRTLFLLFHHFKPNDAVQVLQNAVDHKQPIAIFEAQERSVASMLAMLFSPISVLITTPFIRPFKIGRIIFTYVIPIVPFFVLWDGVVSSLRTYSIKEMKALVSQVEGHEYYRWQMNRLRSGPGVILYLLGTKKHNSAKQ